MIRSWHIFIFITMCVASLFVGVKQLTWGALLTVSDEVRLTFIASRLPRLIAIILTGGGLATCGVILQQIVRNKFAEPATTGGLDAAKLGILAALLFSPSSGQAAKMFYAFFFCLASSLLFVTLIRGIGVRNAALVPVIGLMYGSVLSAVAEFYAYRHNIVQNMQGWLMGDFSKIVQGHYEIVFIILPIMVLCYWFARRLTLLGMGQDLGSSLGLNYKRNIVLALVLVALAVSASVVTVGAIPFIGLVIPNLIALRYGDHLHRTLPLVALAGAALVLACDIASRLIIFPFEVPIGMTAGSFGGVLFLIFLLRRKHG